MKVLTIGGATQDVFIQYDAKWAQLEEKKYVILQEGKKIDVQKISYATGGGATNSAVSFARLGFDTESIFKVGDDKEGTAILDELTREHVDITYCVQTKKHQTGISFIIPSPSGERTVLVYRGANIYLENNEIPVDAIAHNDWLYVTSLSQQASHVLPFITNQAKKYNKKIACNPGTSQLTANIKTLEESLQHIDILIVNSFEAHLLMNALFQNPIEDKSNIKKDNPNLPSLLRKPLSETQVCFSLHQYFHEMFARGPQICVVTNGSDGVYVAQHKKIYYHPSLKFDVVSTLGAGDSFGSTFVAHIAQDYSIKESIRAGIVNAASVLKQQDAKTGLLTKNALQKELNSLDPKEVQVFDL